jgi:hypothetical protein
VTADRSVPRLRLALLGVAGVVLAHVVGYCLAYPDPDHRSVQLAHTGHSYWKTAVIVALFGVIVAFLGELALSFARRRGTQAGAQPDTSVLWSRLAPGQIAAFALLEVAERVFQGADSSAWTEPSFWATLPILLLTAWLGALLLHAAARIGEALARRAGGAVKTVGVCFRPADDAVLSRAALHFLRSRAPPALLVV